MLIIVETRWWARGVRYIILSLLYMFAVFLNKKLKNKKSPPTPKTLESPHPHTEFHGNPTPRQKAKVIPFHYIYMYVYIHFLIFFKAHCFIFNRLNLFIRGPKVGFTAPAGLWGRAWVKGSLKSWKFTLPCISQSYCEGGTCSVFWTLQRKHALDSKCHALELHLAQERTVFVLEFKSNGEP